MSGSTFRMILKDLMIKIFGGYQTLLTQYEKFKTKIRNGELGKSAQFWLIYLDLMKVQHLAHSATQENDFNMRVLAWEKMLPFCFYFNKMNYARYGTYYLQHLTHIKTLNPGMKELLMAKGMSVQAQTVHPVRTATDRRGEQTINKDAKTTGNIYFSRNNFKRQYLDLLK